MSDYIGGKTGISAKKKGRSIMKDEIQGKMWGQ